MTGENVSFKLKVDFAVILTGIGQVLLEAENIAWHTIKILDTSIKYNYTKTVESVEGAP